MPHHWLPRWLMVSTAYSTLLLSLAIFMVLTRGDSGVTDGMTVVFFGAILLPSVIGGVLVRRRAPYKC